MADLASMSLEGESIISVHQYAAPMFFDSDHKNLRVKFESGLEFELIPHKTGWLSFEIKDKNEQTIWSTGEEKYLGNERADYELDLKEILGKSGFVIESGGFQPRMMDYGEQRSIIPRRQIFVRLFLLSPDGMLFMIYPSLFGSTMRQIAHSDLQGFKVRTISH